MITETSHIGENRGPWLHEVVRASEALLSEGAPLRGVCLYPILGMPEWHARDVWTPMGLWDPLSHDDPAAGRQVCEPMLAALRSAVTVEALHRRALAGSATPKTGEPPRWSRATRRNAPAMSTMRARLRG
jgi:hypothetical protein